MVRLRSSASDGFISSFLNDVDKNCSRIGITDNVSCILTGPGASSLNGVDKISPRDSDNIGGIGTGPGASPQKCVDNISPGDTDDVSGVETGPCASPQNGVDKVSPSDTEDVVNSMMDGPCASLKNNDNMIYSDDNDPEKMIPEDKENAQQKLFGTVIILNFTDILDKVYDDEDKDWKFLGFIDQNTNSSSLAQTSKADKEIIKDIGRSLIHLKKKKKTLLRLEPTVHKPVIFLPKHSFSAEIYEDIGEDWEFVGFHQINGNEDAVEGAQHVAGKVKDKCLNYPDDENLNCTEGLESNNGQNKSIIDSPKPISRYEQIRLNNIKERTEHLIKMGIINKSSVVKPKPKKRISRTVSKVDVLPVRRSARLSQSLIDDSSLLALSFGDSDSNESKAMEKKKEIIKKPNSYGVVKGVSIGEIWASRIECSYAGIHRPSVAGIHAGPKGAYSVVLSGGYDDDVDDGDTFMYSGCGGRDLKGTSSNPKNLRVAPQSKDQYKNKSNESLIYSCEHGRAVRVVRGFKLKSAYAPVEGYRYDGLYMIEKWWLSHSHSGFLTYKFLFKRCDNQDLPPWQSSGS